MPYINWYPLTSVAGLNSYFKFEIFYQYFRKLSLICKTKIYLPILFCHYILYSIQLNSIIIYYSSEKSSLVYQKYSSPVFCFCCFVFLCVCVIVSLWLVVCFYCFLLLPLFFFFSPSPHKHSTSQKTVTLLPYDS